MQKPISTFNWTQSSQELLPFPGSNQIIFLSNPLVEPFAISNNANDVVNSTCFNPLVNAVNTSLHNTLAPQIQQRSLPGPNYINQYNSQITLTPHIDSPNNNINENALFQAQIPRTFIPSDPQTNLELALKYYRIAISIRPKYWDASINLAGLLITIGHLNEALQVYRDIEQIMDKELGPMDRFDGLDIYDSVNDAQFYHHAYATEQRRIAISQQLHSNSSFTPERRRDLYFAKGNLLFSLNDIPRAKHEYLKSIAAMRLDVHYIFTTPNSILPDALVTPDQVRHHMNQNILHLMPASNIVQTLAKVYQDSNEPFLAIKFYYAALGIYPAANTCNNIGILLASHRLDESIQWYNLGLNLDNYHVHILVY